MSKWELSQGRREGSTDGKPVQVLHNEESGWPLSHYWEGPLNPWRDGVSLLFPQYPGATPELMLTC